jgi:hypothetical protein
MFRMLPSLFQPRTSSRSGVAARKPQRRTSLSVEALEDRLVLSTAAHFAILGAPSSVQAGTSFTVTVEELANASNRVVARGGATSATLSLTTLGTSVPLGTVALTHGIGHATLKLTKAESARIVATSGAIIGSTGIVVTPGAVSHFAVSAASQETAGTPFQVTITAEDAFSNVVTSFNQTPTLTASYGAPVTVSAITWAKGVGTETVTLDRAGSTTLTATAGSAKGTSAALTVNPGAAVEFYVSVAGGDADVPEVAGASFPVSITALDAFFNIVSSFNQIPTITANFGNSASVSGVSWFAGVAVATVTLDYLGTTTLTVTAGTVTGTSNTISVQPATISNTTWSGYVLNPGSGVTAVAGTWVQPAAGGPNGARNSIWVGIDGWGGSTVEQCGTATEIVNGQAQYVAWYEMYGDAQGNLTGPDYYQVNIPNFTVSAGDTISAEVSLVAGTSKTFLFQMTDVPQGGGAVEAFSLQQTMEYVTPPCASAEWIVENPDYGAHPLTSFDQVSFTGVWAEVDRAPVFEASPALAANAITGPGVPVAFGPIIGGINSFAAPVAVSIVSPAGNAAVSNDPVASSALGYNEPKTGAGSSSFTVTYESANSPSNASPAVMASAIGGNAVADAFFGPVSAGRLR